MSKRVLVPLAEGFEEIEAISIIDVLKRAGIEVVMAYTGTETGVKGGQGIMVNAEVSIDQVEAATLDMVALPGGWGGVQNLAKSERLLNIIKDMEKGKKPIAAICAAPYALDQAGVLRGDYTCYPGFEEKIEQGNFRDDKKVVCTENITTSRGPGTAICFALELVKQLVGEEKFLQLKEGLLADYC